MSDSEQWIAEDLSLHNPVWGVLSKIIKDDRLQYNKDKPVIDITFKFNDRDYKARITNYEEAVSSVDVYCRVGRINNRPAPTNACGGEKPPAA